MNRSPLVNPQECTSCGQCCQVLELPYPRDGPMMEGLLARVKVLVPTNFIEVREEPEVFRIIIKVPCKWLVDDDPNMDRPDSKPRYRCVVYDKPERPYICQFYPYSTKDSCPRINRWGTGNPDLSQVRK